MKRALVIAFAVFAVSCVGRRATVTFGGEGTVFDISPEILKMRVDTLIDVGRIGEGEVVKYSAAIRNAGSEPLVITSVNTSCGCTSVEYEKRPIAPGEAGGFSLLFDSRGMWGLQHKLIEINTNFERQPYRVVVQAEVENNEFSN